MNKIIESVYNPPLKKNGQSLKEFYGNDECVHYYSLARHALKEGLTAYGLKPGDSVLVPAFICRDVLAPFNELGLKIIFFEVNSDLSPRGGVETYPKANAILMVHYFGLVNNIEFFQAYCSFNNALLVEDNAHGLLSRNPEGKLLGTIGDFGVISVRKSLPVENGALLITKNNKSIKDLAFSRKIYLRLILKNLLRPLVAKIGFTGLMKFSEMKRKMRRLFKGNEFPVPTLEEELSIPLPKEPCNFDLYFSKICIDKEVSRRRELFYFLKQFLKEEKIVPLRDELSLFEVPYMYPFYCEHDAIEKIEKLLKSIGLELIQWPALPKVVLEKPHEKFYENLYMVRFLW